MTNQFHFKDFDADEATQVAASSTLEQILDRAPHGAAAIALLEKQKEGYRCSIELYTRKGPFIASTIRTSALDAIHATEDRIRRQADAMWPKLENRPRFFESANCKAAS